MSDVIRVDLDLEEACHLNALLREQVAPRRDCVECESISGKLRKAIENPLNGPTFDFARHSDVEIPEEHGGEA